MYCTAIQSSRYGKVHVLYFFLEYGGMHSTRNTKYTWVLQNGLKNTMFWSFWGIIFQKFLVPVQKKFRATHSVPLVQVNCSEQQVYSYLYCKVALVWAYSSYSYCKSTRGARCTALQLYSKCNTSVLYSVSRCYLQS